MKEKSKAMIMALSMFLLVFYVAIILYIFFGVIHIQVLHNYVTGMVFEIIGFGFLGFLVLGNMLSHSIKTGYSVPIVMVTIIYTILLDTLNIAGSLTMPGPFFTLFHLILLFVYCLVLIPMYVMGKR